MKKVLALVFLLALWTRCSNKKEETPLCFDFKGIPFSFPGFCDVEGKFYQHHWPENHTAESLKKTNSENKEVLCGRWTSHSKDTMVEIHISWPYHEEPGDKEIMGLVNDTIWTLNNLPGKRGNHDSIQSVITGKYFRLTLAMISSGQEFLPDMGPLGYLHVRSVAKNEAANYIIKGNFEISVNGPDYKTYRLSRGKFNLEFYRGL